ncbi:MAG: CvpA family protein [Candidatus Pelagadaptatus aseana]|uniref:CvpA family protein n=1 Tax=Candidatus Pelagadaptatus aseana TaxID=3120508 RepID=UPI0039B13606
MNWADWSIIAILVVSSLIGMYRGFIKEALSLLTWVVAFVLAMTFRDPMSLLLVDMIDTPSVRQMAAFAILFVATLIVGAMVNYLISELVRMTGLSGTDRLFGMMFGVARGAAVVLAIIILLPPLIAIDQDSWWQQSKLIPHFQAMEDWAKLITARLTDYFVNLF